MCGPKSTLLVYKSTTSLCDVENLNVAYGLFLTKHAFLRVGYCLFRLLAETISRMEATLFLTLVVIVW